ncbi:hypothetical protein [Sphingomonas sp. NIBR02145]|uniref:hypothetical protein n=1 Tax=Sphingomonas sp. NIBR02145 TaxID=3014784 RepID=UPI0022B4BD50|nr:hypothetical protein [Sphingomonas sp. NIBR02145]WHU02592.1 hypothetical protein O3305_20820 [Sphingomonas sp. NIBR02145]
MSEEPDASGDFWERTFDEPKIAKAGCYGVLVAGVVGIVLLVSQCASGSHEEPVSEATTSSAPDETEIVTECDLTLKAALVSPRSYDPSMAWDYKDQGSYATVLRKFEATNSFGAGIGGTYLCKWDKAGQRIASLETIDALGKHTVVR